MSRSIGVLLCLALVLTACRGRVSATSRYPEPIPTILTGPVLFSPGYVSSGLAERDATFAPDGSIFAFTQMDEGEGRIVLLQLGNPEVAPFSGVHSDIEPFFDPRGGAMWFASNRPHPDDATRTDWNLWYVSIDEEGDWGEPQIVRGLDEPSDEFYPTIAMDGTVAFTSDRPGGYGGEDIWIARPGGASGWTIENAGEGVNGPGSEFNAFIAKNGNLLLFSSDRSGMGDLFASTRRWTAEPVEPAAPAEDDEDRAPLPPFFVIEGTTSDAWGPAVPLTPYNSGMLDYSPAMTPDGLYLVFTSRRKMRTPPENEQEFSEMRGRLTGPGNGLDDLWWALMPTVQLPSSG